MVRRRLFALAAGFVILAGLATLLMVHPWDQPAHQSLTANQSLTYTNSITGASSTDLPQESSSAAVSGIASPTIGVDGADALGAYLTNDQIQYVEQNLKDFLAARSGLSVVDAGILNQQILQSNSNLEFTLVVDRPQATYHVTIDTSDSQNPNVSLEQIN